MAVPMRARLRRLLGAPHAAPAPVVRPSGLAEVLRDGPAPLSGAAGSRAEARSLHVAVVVPAFRRGSGGHATIANLVRGLEAAGHECSLWLLDDEGRHAGETPAATAASFHAFFGPVAGAVHRDLSAFSGADVVVATGWQTVPAVLRLPGAAARAYLVQDHEPEFYPTSAERLWAEWTYRQGLHCIAASPWLAELVAERYGAAATPFDLGIDHAQYAPGGQARRDDLVLFYARAVTPRRAVPLGLLALEELKRRRPAVEVGLFGESTPLRTPFAHRDLGVLDAAALTGAYRSATVGMVLSLTNPSLIPQEMLACGLPCVDVAAASMVATFGADGPVTLADPDPLALCAAIEALLDDPAARAARARAGIAWAAPRTWAGAAGQVADGLRAALRSAA